MPDTDFCQRLVYWGQYGPTCWFNAILMCTLYSQKSRDLILRTSKSWNMKIKIYKIFKHILKYKYVKSKNVEKDIRFFDDIRPEKILKLLHDHNKKKFMVEANFDGFSSDIYIKRFYKLLNASCMMLYNIGNNQVVYDRINHISSCELLNDAIRCNIKLKKTSYVRNKLAETPDVLIVRCNNYNDINKKFYDKMKKDGVADYYVNDTNNAKNVCSMNDSIKYNGVQYDLDSVILSNCNEQLNNHAIAGITCKGNRYVYNGWTLKTNDAAIINKVLNKLPCELMKFSWNVKKNVPFCLNARACKLDLIYKNKIVKDVCFSFAKGNRLLIYIKKQDHDIVDYKYSKTPEYVSYGRYKECGEDKIMDPMTKRCIKLQTAIKRNLIKSDVVRPNKKTRPMKPCKDTKKIRDPNTRRCVQMKTAILRRLI